MRYTETATIAICCFIIAAAPLAAKREDWRIVVWTGAGVSAGYLKGKLEEKP